MADEQIVLGASSEKNESKPTINPVNEGTTIPVEESTEKTIKEVAKEHNIPEQYLDTEFQVPTETVELPSKGAFYANNKKTVTLKYLTQRNGYNVLLYARY